MCDFVALLHPLPLDLLPFVFVAFRESSGETFWATLQRLTSHVDRALCANLNPDTAAAVRHKLQVWESQQRLPGPATVVCVPCLGTSCGDCGRELTPLESLRCKVLTFDKGSVPAVCDVSRCDPCRTTFFGGVCSVDGVLGLHLRQCPSDMPYFGLLAAASWWIVLCGKESARVLEFGSVALARFLCWIPEHLGQTLCREAAFAAAATSFSWLAVLAGANSSTWNIVSGRGLEEFPCGLRQCLQDQRVATCLCP